MDPCRAARATTTTTTPVSGLPSPDDPATGDVRYEWRATFSNHDVNALHAQAFAHPELDIDWRAQVERHSLGWVCATDASNGLASSASSTSPGTAGSTPSSSTPLVEQRLRRIGVGRGLLEVAERQSRAAGCEWLHVDFEEERRDFYLGSCGFISDAGRPDRACAESHAGHLAVARRSPPDRICGLHGEVGAARRLPRLPRSRHVGPVQLVPVGDLALAALHPFPMQPGIAALYGSRGSPASDATDGSSPPPVHGPRRRARPRSPPELGALGPTAGPADAPVPSQALRSNASWSSGWAAAAMAQSCLRTGASRVWPASSAIVDLPVPGRPVISTRSSAGHSARLMGLRSRCHDDPPTEPAPATVQESASFSHTETCEVLAPVNGSRLHPLQRSRRRIPAIRAMRSSSAGQT